jgi:hypothetical protein
MKKFRVEAENISNFYILVEAKNITEAYLQAIKLPQSNFRPSFEVDQWHVFSSDIIEVPTFEKWIMDNHPRRFSVDLVDAMEDTDLQEDYLYQYGLSEKDML